MRKQMLVLALVVLLVGGVGAGGPVGSLTNISKIYINDFIAGTTATANFSFNYLDNYGNKQYPHVLQINITSNDTAYPVWKNDFELSGFVRKSTLWGWSYEDIELKCSEKNPLMINHPLGLNTLEVLNGTFYCYNETSEVIENLNKHDEVYLTIRSHPALWPGQYSLTAMTFYLEDTLGPLATILNKANFETKTFTIGNHIDIVANVSDNVGVDYCKWIINQTENVSYTSYENNGQCELEIDIPSALEEGVRLFEAKAYDVAGNVGSDFVNIVIDNSPPVINLMSPNESGIYGEIIPVELNVTDKYSDIEKTTVQYRIKELGCSDTGIGLNGTSCFNSGWLNMVDNGNGNYTDSFNATEEGMISGGEFWFDARACDVLYDASLFTSVSIDSRHCSYYIK